MLRDLTLFAVAAVVSSLPATPALSQSDAGAPRIEIWTSQRGGYRSGENARAYFRTTVAGFVTILHVDPDGSPRVLFPERPSDDNSVRAGYQYLAAPSGARYAFAVRSSSGTGYLVGVVSREPFDYDAYARGGGGGGGGDWDYSQFGPDGNVSGDAHDAARSFIHDIVTSHGPFDYAYDVVSYEVQDNGRPARASDESRRAGGYAYPRGGYGYRYRSPYYGGYSYPYYGGRGRYRLGIGHFGLGHRRSYGYFGFGHRRSYGHSGFGHRRVGHRGFGHRRSRHR